MPEQGKLQSTDTPSTGESSAGQMTTEGFVALLADGIQALHGGTEASADLLDICFQRGWLESADLSGRRLPLEKRRAAGIVHAFLRRELGEADEEDFGAAAALSDLYDCRVCVAHVAQVYVKGILTADEEGARPVFGMRRILSRAEAETIVQRVFDKSRRLKAEPSEKKRSCTVLSRAEALELLAKQPAAVLIDVRTEAQYAAGHLQGAKNIPMSEVLKNPYRTAPDIHTLVFFYCTEGAQSTIAANCAADAGFAQVYAFGTDCDGDAVLTGETSRSNLY